MAKPTSVETLLDVRGLKVEYARGRGRRVLRAVDNVTFDVASRETVGLVGESGSGKTTIGRAVLGLTPIAGGTVALAGEDITRASGPRRRRLSRDLQVVFQDPYSSLNPTRTIGQTLRETLSVHDKAPRSQLDERVQVMLSRVGLPGDAAHRYPMHFSGGQRQRIAIARALIVSPRLIICDEAVSALDLSVQANVLNLLRELQAEFHVGYLFIAHDLEVVRQVCHRVIVLYRGQIMEQGDSATIYRQPSHPYTRALLDAAPVPVPALQRERRAARASRAVQDRSLSIAEPSAEGCPFAPRCPHAVRACIEERPALEQTLSGAEVACHRWRELQDQPVAQG